MGPEVEGAGASGRPPGGGGGAAAAVRPLSLVSYIAGLAPEVAASLYASPWTCQAVFRALEPLAQQYVLRLLYAGEPLADGLVRHWAKANTTAARKHEAALRLLQALGLLQREARGGATSWALHPTFQAQLRAALADNSPQGGGALDPLVAALMPGQDAIAEYAAKQWEGVLTYLLDPARQAPPELPVGLRTKPLDVADLVARAGLVSGDGGGLTAGGFRFMLMGTDSQLWLLLREYISSAEHESAAQLSSVLSFLMQLGFRQVGRPYPLSALGELERRIAAHMAQLGLLFTFQVEGALYYCPTALASSLCGGGGGGGGAAAALGGGLAGGSGDGYVIVETNFRVLAYTSSRIQVRVLEEFCRLDCVLPNLFVGTLTRDSVQRALAKGMSGTDIVGFLQQHAHPQVTGRVPSVPETVQDQIRLWERETQRVELAPGTCYTVFEDATLFERARAFAQQSGVLLWDNADAPLDASRRVMVVAAHAHRDVRDHIKDLKARGMGVMGGPL